MARRNSLSGAFRTLRHTKFWATFQVEWSLECSANNNGNRNGGGGAGETTVKVNHWHVAADPRNNGNGNGNFNRASGGDRK